MLPRYQSTSSSFLPSCPLPAPPFPPLPHLLTPSLTTLSLFLSSLSLRASLGAANRKPQLWSGPHVLHLRKLEQEKGKIEDLKVHSSPSTSKIKKKKKTTLLAPGQTSWESLAALISVAKELIAPRSPSSIMSE